MKRLQLITPLILICLLNACGGNSFEDKEDYVGSTISHSGDRMVGVKQKFKGACDTSDSWHPIDWCGNYDNAGFVKDHTFQLWTSSETAPRTFIASYSDAGRLDGQWSEELQGEVYHTDYIHTDTHHYVLASARILDFVEVNTPIRSGQFVVYKINLSDNGSINSIQDVENFSAQCDITYNSAIHGKASPNGDYISVVSQGDCVPGPKTATILEANSLNVIHTTTLTSSNDTFVHAWEGGWTAVVEGSTDAELARVTSEPSVCWDQSVAGPNSMANPLFREAVVDFVRANETLEQAQAKSMVFILQYDGFVPGMKPGKTLRTQIRISPDGNISEQELSLEEVPFGMQWNSGNYNQALLFDFATLSYRRRTTSTVTTSTPFSGSEELPYLDDSTELELGGTSFLFDDDNNKTLNHYSGAVDLSHNYTQGSPVSEGMMLNESYRMGEQLGTRRILVELECTEKAENVQDEHSYDYDRQCQSDWGGLHDEYQNRSHGQYSWTFTDTNELYICLAMTSNENSARNVIIDKGDLNSGCNGTSWRKLLPREYY